MSIYRIDVKIIGTAYVRAKSARDAAYKARTQLKDKALEVASIPGESDVQVSGRRFDDPTLPDISLSPAMTLMEPVSEDPELVE